MPINMFATIINSLVGLGRFMISGRKTKKDRIEELKTEIRVFVSNEYGFKMYPQDVENMFASLPPEFQKPKYKELHRAAYHELRLEGRLEHIFDIPSSAIRNAE